MVPQIHLLVVLSPPWRPEPGTLGLKGWLGSVALDALLLLPGQGAVGTLGHSWPSSMKMGGGQGRADDEGLDMAAQPI